MQENKPGWITGRNALSQYCGLSVRKISELMAKGKLPHHRVSHKLVMFRVEDVDFALRHLEQAGPSDES